MAFSAGAVLTAAQLNDLNVTTLSTTGVIDAAAGSAAAPAYTFTGDTDTGIYRSGANQLSIATLGAVRFTIDATAITSTVPVYTPVGSAAAPAYTFTGDTDTGIYRTSTANILGVGCGGTESMVISSAGARFRDGTESLPGITFINDTNTGFHRGTGSDDVIAATCGGTNSLVILNTQTRFLDGSVSAPSIAFNTDTNTGLYLSSSSTGTMRFSVQGVNILQIASTNLSPVPASTIELGVAAARWERVWTVAVDCSADAIFGGKVRVGSFTNATRGAAADAGAGAVIWNTDDGFPNWSDGTNWVTSSGATT